MSESKALEGDALRQAREMAMETKPIAIDYVEGHEGIKVPIVAGYNGPINGYKLLDVRTELERWRAQPERRSGKASAHTLSSFIGLVNRHKDDDTAIFAAIRTSAPSVTAVIDYHKIDHSPRWSQHKVAYAWPLSREWKTWQGVVGNPLVQAAFGEFLEDHIHEIVDADDGEKAEYENLLGLRFGTGADVLKLARGISISANIAVKEIVTLASGEASIAFDEAHDVKGFDGKPLKVPSLLIVSVPLFEGGTEVRVPLRLRYRRKGAGVEWTLLLFRADDIVRRALEADLDEIGVETSLPIFEGVPEA